MLSSQLPIADRLSSYRQENRLSRSGFTIEQQNRFVDELKRNFLSTSARNSIYSTQPAAEIDYAAVIAELRESKASLSVFKQKSGRPILEENVFQIVFRGGNSFLEFARSFVVGIQEISARIGKVDGIAVICPNPVEPVQAKFGQRTVVNAVTDYLGSFKLPSKEGIGECLYQVAEKRPDSSLKRIC